MPGSRLQLPYKPPEWLTNEQPDDPYWLQVARRAAKLVGVGDPVGIGMGLPGAALETGAVDATGQLIKGPLTKLSEVVRRGLYSRLDDYAALIGKEGVSPARLAKIVSKDSALAEEAAFRKVPQLIEAGGGKKVTQKTIPLSQVQAHLQAHPAPKPKIVTRGASTDPAHVYAARDLLANGATPEEAMTALQQSYKTATPGELSDALFAATNPAYPAGPTKFGTYQVPGGEAYRETLLTLPEKGGLPEGWRTGPSATDPGQVGVFNAAGDQVTRAATAEEAIAQAQHYSTASGRYRSTHFDEPNIVVHTRANERTLPTGERGRFIEEVQSDWHQAGKKQGYAAPTPPPLRPEDVEVVRITDGAYPYWESSDMRTGQLITRHPGDMAEDAVRAEALRIGPRETPGVPDAPFKKTWPKLGLKQQVLEAAADPTIEWIGHTTGATQAARYDLSKQISELHYSGSTLKAYDHAGNEVISRTGVRPEDLPDYIGKEAANKLLAQPKQGTLQSLTGVDLQVGGEGMLMEYDQKLSADLQDILRPFGGKVETPGPPAPVWNTRTQAWETPQGGLGGGVSAAITEAHHGTRQMAEAFFDTAQARGDLINGKLPVGRSRRLMTREELGEAFTSGRLTAFDMDEGLRAATSTVTEPAWLARLTPEMKREILEKGLPLSVLLGLIPLSQVGTYGQPPPESR